MQTTPSPAVCLTNTLTGLFGRSRMARTRALCLGLAVLLAGSPTGFAAMATSGPARGQNAPAASTTPPPPAWASYSAAMAWWDANARGASATLTQADHILLSDPLIGPPTAAHRAALAKIRPYLDLVRTGGRAAAYGNELDRSKGFQLVLPHLGSLRNAARALRLDAEVRLADGDVRGALESLEATAGFSKHVRDDRLLVSSLVSAAIGVLNDQTIETAIGMGAVDAEAAESLLAAIAPLSGIDGVRVGDAIEGEAEIMRMTVEQGIAAREAGAPSLLAELMELDATAANGDTSPERLREQLAIMESMYAEAAGAARNPDREAARAVLASIDARVEAGEAGPLGTALMPALDRAVEAAWRVEDMLADRMRLLEDIRSGRVSVDSLANAAHAYLAIARMTDGMDREEQAAIEAARLAPFALNEASARAARELIEPLREPLRRQLRLAARRERCDFAFGRIHPPELIPEYVPGLRAAFRVMLTDALLALRDDAPAANAGAGARGDAVAGVGPNAAPASESNAAKEDTLATGDATASGATGDARVTAVVAVADGVHDVHDVHDANGHTPFSLPEVAVATLRLTAHCGRDPRVGHLLALGSMLDEVATACRDAVASIGAERALDAKAMPELRRAIARIAGPDPLASTAAADRERERLRNHMRRAGQSERDIEQLLGRGMRTMAFALLLQQLAAIELPEGDDGSKATPDMRWLPAWWETTPGAAPLRSAMDLLSADSSALATTRITAWRDQLRAPESAESPPDWFRFINATPWPETIDPDAARDRGLQAIAALDKLAAAEADARDANDRQPPVGQAPTLPDAVSPPASDSKISGAPR
jgi:hypothetical protein